jgi:hypothetical protein
MKLQKASLEIFNSRQNRIQYEEHYMTQRQFSKIVKKNEVHEKSCIFMQVTIASKYTKQVL